MIKIQRKAVLLSICLIVSSLTQCVKNQNFDAPESSCNSGLAANATYGEIKNLYLDETVQIQEDLIIEGYVISSDQEGNFFSTLRIQDKPDNPTDGFQLEIDLRDSHVFYEVGSRILIKLKGLYLGKSKGVFKLGGVFTAFGNVSVGRLPAAALPQHLFLSCDAAVAIQPHKTTISRLREHKANTLISFDMLEFAEAELGKTYAVPGEETERILTDCEDNEITLVNSGFSEFQNELVPEGNGNITGVFFKENDDYQLIIRSLLDMDFKGDRCEEINEEVSSELIFISEIADPDNNRAARFLEIYNSSADSVPLKGWKLRRYTNANTEAGSTIDLSDFTIHPKGTLVIAANAEEFENVYGFPPDLQSGTNSPADSNGDDNLELVDPFDRVIDIFGVIGEDGSGTNHEFEDGRALRNADIDTANPLFTFSEWTIYNDSGQGGTVNAPQNAPEDFTPGER